MGGSDFGLCDRIRFLEKQQASFERPLPAARCWWPISMQVDAGPPPRPGLA
jgi:hypothetical protein